MELTAVAFVFGIEGLLAGVSLLSGLMSGRFVSGLGVLGIGIAIGLLRLNRTAYRLARLTLWLAIPGIAVFPWLMFFGPSIITAKVAALPTEQLVRIWAFVIASTMQTLWQLRVLHRDRIRELFDAQSSIVRLTAGRKAQAERTLRARRADERQQLPRPDAAVALAMHRPEAAPIIVSRQYDAPAEEVFDPWLDVESMRRFLVGSGDGTDVRATLDPKIGGHFWILDQRAEWMVEHSGAYSEIARPERLVFLYSPDRGTVAVQVTIELRPIGEGCVLTVMQERDASWSETAREGVIRWTKVLDNLQRLVSRSRV